MSRDAAFDMDPQEFRALGHRLIDEAADLLASLRERPVTRGESPAQVRAALPDAPLPEQGREPGRLLSEAVGLLGDHSLWNGHPRFAGYVTSSAAPIGILGDLLASAFNPNTGAWILAPMAVEMEAQAVRWIAEFLGYPRSCGGLLVSGGNMANFVGFLAARRAAADWDIRAEGPQSGGRRLVVYASSETHTWIQKAADLFGLGTGAIRWLAPDKQGRMDVAALREAIAQDKAAGARPFLVVGSAGTVSTGAVDPLRDMAAVAREEGLWLHVDGAYGAPAAAVAGAPDDLKALAEADSVAVDPHKWLYMPLEAGCALVRDPQRLLDAFDYSPAYYRFDADAAERPINYYALGPQNSRGFRALKVWLGMQAAGREGLARMIGDDIALARRLFEQLPRDPDLERLTCGLSIVTFRYAPPGVEDLNGLNEALLDRIQKSGELFLSNAIVDGKYALRLCLVNFRTTTEDIDAIPGIVRRLGEELLAAGR